MILVRDHLHPAEPALRRVPIVVDRRTLARKRWRGVASDGAEFGFELEHALADGDAVHATAETVYVVEQSAEAVLEIPLAGDPAEAAKLGWTIGNLHFPLEIGEGVVRVADDPALRQLFAREKIGFEERHAVFRPLAGGHHH